MLDFVAGSEDSSSEDGECGRGKRKRTARRLSPSYQTTPMLSSANAAHKKGKRRVSARERNLRRLESNERERMRMHSLNDAFEVQHFTIYSSCFIIQNGKIYILKNAS
jgi:hypothetical protein